jgi:hypothetical protein
MKHPRLRALLFAVAVLTLAMLAYGFAHPPRIASEDFDAFYCAAKSLPADPYRYEPLHSCETRNLHPSTPNAAVPAPLPPYAIAAFTPFTRIPFPQAELAWWLVLLLSTLAIIWAVVELTSLPLFLVGFCIVASALLQCLQNGALAPLPIAALSLAAVALARGRHTLAALALVLSCIEPHMALPPILAVFLLVPAMRARLAIGLAAIVAISLAAGPQLNIEYVASVLPAHAVSELGTAGQYGLSALLHAVGFSDRISVGLGSAQYALFVIVGLWLAYSLQRVVPGAAVLAPMTCAVTGGTFVHATQIAGAIPFALAIAAQDDGAVAWIGATALAIPWQFAIEESGAAFAGIVMAAVLVYRRAPWALAVASGVALATVLWLLSTLAPAHGVVAVPAIAPSEFAEVAWQALAGQYPPNLVSWIGHALTYLGLACVYWAGITLARAVRASARTVVARA